MEESIPSSIKSGSLKGIPPREVIEYVTQGDLQTSSLKLTKSDEKVNNNIHHFVTCLTHVHMLFYTLAFSVSIYIAILVQH